jgi:hypothetical protein
MLAAAAVSILKTVVPVCNDVVEPARGAGTGVVVSRENMVARCVANTEGIPHSGCEAGESFPVFCAAPDISALAFIAVAYSIGSGESVGFPEDTPDSENQISFVVKTQAGATVVEEVPV